MTHTEIHLHQATTLTPEQYVSGLTDFGPGRSKLFGNSADEYLKVHRRGRSEADVTEGSGGIWERLHYDWSDPNRVVLTTTDSNVWGGASGHTYTFTRQPNGTTDIDVIVVREGKTSRDECSASCCGPSAGAFWKRRLKTPLMPSKPGTKRRDLQQQLEPFTHAHPSTSCCPPSMSKVAPVKDVFVMMCTANAATSAGPTTRRIRREVRSCSRRASSLRQSLLSWQPVGVRHQRHKQHL